MNHHDGTKDTKTVLRVMHSLHRHAASTSRRHHQGTDYRQRSRRKRPVQVRLHVGEPASCPQRPVRSLLRALRAFVVKPTGKSAEAHQSPIQLTLFKEHS